MVFRNEQGRLSVEKYDLNLIFCEGFEHCETIREVEWLADIFRSTIDNLEEEFIEFIEDEIIMEIYYEYFEQFEDEYNTLENIKCNFWDFITSRYEDIVYYFSFKLYDNNNNNKTDEEIKSDICIGYDNIIEKGEII